MLWPLMLATCGCFPYHTRHPTDAERDTIADMTVIVADRALRTGDPMDVRVAEELRRALTEGRIRVFEDTEEYCTRGIVVFGRMYLRDELLRDDRRSRLRTFYHEGVHLAQGFLRLLCEPEASEDEAHEAAGRFMRDVP